MMLILFVTLLSSCFVIVPEIHGADSKSVHEAGSTNASVPSLTEAPSANQLHGADSTSANQKAGNQEEKCVQCNTQDGAFDTCSSIQTDSCDHKLCYMCYLINRKDNVKFCPDCKFCLLGYKAYKS
ncbi:uncharacterized protein LOC126897472 isoform X1 [Daktulosphaira vitifoliae]|uniref:uncharacterized protein LOC126897472 isoform X1 n=1 Tax=Daktulosphaira vitifoliae TaxID=58002 RepID=UPI0021AA8594|nr:uncharacterized protein LOC126897472 isoform X1 [Daktulosphaira vitifoliae]